VTSVMDSGERSLSNGGAPVQLLKESPWKGVVRPSLGERGTKARLTELCRWEKGSNLSRGIGGVRIRDWQIGSAVGLCSKEFRDSIA
jgi:hypothetical protein